MINIPQVKKQLILGSPIEFQILSVSLVVPLYVVLGIPEHSRPVRSL
jgi:hypothetical protein